MGQTEPTTGQDLEMLEKAVGGARTAGIPDDDAGLQSLLLHLSKLRAQLGMGDSAEPPHTGAAGKAADKQPAAAKTERVADIAEANASAEALDDDGGAGGPKKGSCAAEGGGGQASDTAATEAPAHDGEADDDLPALDLYADEDGASKKRKRRRRKRK